MISVHVPHFANNHPLPNYYPMSDPSYLNGMHSFSKPAPLYSPMSDSKSKASSTGVKKRPSRAGTRSVSTLTSAQLERKRANDREAQRAIRQRTKDHIDSLERRIRELTAADDTSARLMQALQRNEELEQENAILRSRLNHAVAAMAEGTRKFFSFVVRFSPFLLYCIGVVLLLASIAGFLPFFSPLEHRARSCISPKSKSYMALTEQRINSPQPRDLDWTNISNSPLEAVDTSARILYAGGATLGTKLSRRTSSSGSLEWSIQPGVEQH
jgi:hypothetical protein